MVTREILSQLPKLPKAGIVNICKLNCIFLRLYVYGNVGEFTVVFFQQLLNLRCLVVGLTQADVAVHAYVQLDGIVVADASCAQVVRLLHVRERCHHRQYLLLHIVGQRLLH